MQREYRSARPSAIRCRGLQPRAKRITAAIESLENSAQRDLARPGGPRVNSGVRTIPFVKASACGNDFLLIDFSLALPEADIHAFTQRICDRHEGVGADGVEWMLPHRSADVEIRLINADGSEAEISGNGTRCVAAYLCSEQGKEKITIQTGAGLKACILTSHRDWQYEFEIAMGNAAVEKELKVKTRAGE